jgi:hypothetical protein
MELIEQRLGFCGRIVLPLQSDQDRAVGAGDDLGVERVERLIGLVFGFGHVAELKKGKADFGFSDGAGEIRLWFRGRDVIAITSVRQAA